MTTTKTKAMRFSVRFKIGNRAGAASKYTTRDICINLVDRYSLREHELCTIFTLHTDERFENEDMIVVRVS